MQSPLAAEGSFLEREPVSHELHRSWRYVTPLCLLFSDSQILKFRNLAGGC